MTDLSSLQDRRYHVFLSYASDDRSAATRVATALRDAGLTVWFDSWELKPGDSITERIDRALRSSDLLLILLSPRSVASKWVRLEMDAALMRDLNDRAITVIPALIDDCEIPAALKSRPYVDLRHDLTGGIQHLSDQINAVPKLEFSGMSGRRFETLVSDLLTDLGFSVEHSSLTRDTGFDLVASYNARDPFGANVAETWLVEAKLYRDQRLSVSALRQMLGYLMTSTRGKKGLVVTNGRLTSAAREFLTDFSGPQIRVVDGAELTNLLIQRPNLVRRHFREGSGDA